RRDLARVIRQVRPDRVVCPTPERNYQRIAGSHPDHRAVGSAALDAVYPDARNPRAYRDLLTEGFEPHKVKEVWVGGLDQPDVIIDAAPFMDKKMQAILCHASQFQKPDMEPGTPEKWIRDRMRQTGERHGLEYAEGFRRLETG
ncbi:MAG: PIG-L family deacetylase, partial [Candidatus Dormibacteraeota bacterium]|nr:PIG-L family deacetylase [Candidatus Dormibacteraeota bacterium]